MIQRDFRNVDQRNVAIKDAGEHGYEVAQKVGVTANQKHRRESIKQRARAQTIEEGEVLAESVKKAKMGLRDEEL